MISVIKSEDRYEADFGWLKARWHFSFGDYHDPRNMNWSVLRVFNDDVVQGGGGFDMHPHRDMEIITYVIEGQLRHQDHLSNKGVVSPGEVQVMSAGRGIMHGEFNASKTDPVHLLQLWVLPRNKSNKPRWEQKVFSQADRGGKLLPVVTGTGADGTLQIDQDATVYVSSLQSGQAVTHTSSAGRKAYFFVISGEVTLNGQTLRTGDQARIADEPRLDVTAQKDAELMLLDLP